MPKTLAVCSKCGRTEEWSKAQKCGWLIHQIKNAPQGHLIIRCPEHVTGHALRLAGLPQQTTSKRIEQNLGRGLWTYYGHPDDDYTAAVGYGHNPDDGSEYFYISYHHGEMPAFNTECFDTVEALIAAMRKAEPDLRKWRLTEL